MIGDIVGEPGCALFQKYCRKIKEQYAIDAVIVNGENSAANGRGISPKTVHFFRHNGADVITTGNHIWANKEIYNYLLQHTDLLRPDNFPSECPGSGVTRFQINGVIIGVLNLQGRIFMREHVSCPFKAADSALTFLRAQTNIILVDFHAEASSEKIGMGFYLDGRVSTVVGTHTHVQTADERILPNGTAFITDLGMAGSLNSMIGMNKEIVLQHLITQMPARFAVETKGPFVFCGVIIDIDLVTGKATAIERLRIIDNELVINQKSV